MGICSSLGERILTLGTHLCPEFHETMRGKGVLECHVPHLALVEGEYSVMVAMGVGKPRQNIDCIDGALRFRVESGDYFRTGAGLLRGQGYFAQKSSWHVLSADDDESIPRHRPNPYCKR